MTRPITTSPPVTEGRSPVVHKAPGQTAYEANAKQLEIHPFSPVCPWEDLPPGTHEHYASVERAVLAGCRFDIPVSSPLERERFLSIAMKHLDTAFWAGSEMAQGYDSQGEAEVLLSALQQPHVSKP